MPPALLLLLSLPACDETETDHPWNDEGCAAAICGCWEVRTQDWSAEIVDDSDTAIEGATVSCSGSVLATSDASGLAAFAREGDWSPGCSWAECAWLTVEADGFAPQEVRAETANGGRVTLAAATD